jgi:hypothetical protein
LATACFYLRAAFEDSRAGWKDALHD